MGHSKGIGLFLRGEIFWIVTGVSLCIFFFLFFGGGGVWGCILRHLGGNEEGKGEEEEGEGEKREKFLTIVNISKKKYMPKNAYFIPSNICRSVLLFPPFPPSLPLPAAVPAALPPTPFDDDPAKIFSQAISQQGYHFNNRKYLLPEMTFTLSAFLFFFFSFLYYKYQKKEKEKKRIHTRAQQNRDISRLSLSLYCLLRVVMVVVVIYSHTQSQFSP